MCIVCLDLACAGYGIGLCRTGIFRPCRGEQLLIQEPHEEPVGGEVKADDASYVPAAASIVPGAGFSACQQLSGGIFQREDQAHIRRPSCPERFFAEEEAQRREEGGAPVDRKHPEGGASLKGHIPAAQGACGGEKNLHAPACQTAFAEVFEKGGYILSHGNTPFFEMNLRIHDMAYLSYYAPWRDVYT